MGVLWGMTVVQCNGQWEYSVRPFCTKLFILFIYIKYRNRSYEICIRIPEFHNPGKQDVTCIDESLTSICPDMSILFIISSVSAINSIYVGFHLNFILKPLVFETKSHDMKDSKCHMFIRCK